MLNDFLSGKRSALLSLRVEKADMVRGSKGAAKKQEGKSRREAKRKGYENRKINT